MQITKTQQNMFEKLLLNIPYTRYAIQNELHTNRFQATYQLTNNR